LKTLEQLIEERAIALPYKDVDLAAAYKLGQINMLLDLAKNAKGHVINGLMRGAITEEELTDKLVEISNA